MTEIVTLLEKIPGGIGWAILFLLVFGPPAIFSKTAAEKFGAFGAVARWWRNRPLQRIENKEKQVTAEVAVLERRVKLLEDHLKRVQTQQEEERKAWQKAAAEDREQWRKALDDAEREIEEVRKGLRTRDNTVFALYDWSIRARVAAINGGVTLPPIPEISLLAIEDKGPTGEISPPEE